MAEIIKEGTPGIYNGAYKPLKGMGGYVKEDTPLDEGYILIIFDEKKESRLRIDTITWMPKGTVFENKTDKRGRPIETIVEVEPSE